MQTIIGSSGNDVLTAKTAGDAIIGKGGSDVLTANGMGNVLVGDGGSAAKSVALDKMSIHQDVNAHVHFDGSAAGFHNTVGMYVYDNAGNVVSTSLLFNDVSAQGVAGGAVDMNVALKAGQHIGFFVAPNAAGLNDIQKLVADGGTFHLVNTKDGAPANVFSGEPMQIAYETPDHQWSVVHTQYWTDIYTTNTNDNRDGFQHASVSTDAATGQMHVKFEDLQGGGDRNFFDANFTVDIGTANAVLMAHDGTTASAASHDDTLVGGAGNDILLGLAGNDTLIGGAGNDKIYGGSGDDIIDGVTGHDMGNEFGSPIHPAYVSKEHDALFGGAGNDHIYSAGNSEIVGGSGFDTLDYSRFDGSVSVDLTRHLSLLSNGTGDYIEGVEALIGTSHNDSLSGDKRANTIDGGAGNDIIIGGKGADILTGGAGHNAFIWQKSDVGTGVDHITDLKSGDRLDLKMVVGNLKGTLDDKVKVVDDVAGSHLYAKVGGQFVEVATLDNVHHTTAADLLQAGMLLI
jgi:Ca2+-binding RTX toxin-like protein